MIRRLGNELDVVELGCGTGGLAAHLAALGHRVTAIDRERRAIVAARERYGPKFLERSIEHTRLPARRFDFAVSADALYLAREPGRALREVGRILRPGGRLLFSYYQSEIFAGVSGELFTDWPAELACSGFKRLYRWDATARWRRQLRAKHQARLEHADALLALFGSTIFPYLDISRTMVGDGNRASFISHTRRYWISAKRCEP